jgi:hypothetical protein
MAGSPLDRIRQQTAPEPALTPATGNSEPNQTLPAPIQNDTATEKELRLVQSAIQAAIRRLRAQGKKMKPRELAYWIKEWNKVHENLGRVLKAKGKPEEAPKIDA